MEFILLLLYDRDWEHFIVYDFVEFDFPGVFIWYLSSLWIFQLKILIPRIFLIVQVRVEAGRLLKWGALRKLRNSHGRLRTSQNGIIQRRCTLRLSSSAAFHGWYLNEWMNSTYVMCPLTWFSFVPIYYFMFWTLLLYRQIRISEEEGEEYLSIYLFAGDLANLPEGWSRFTNFKLSLIDQANGERTIVQGIFHTSFSPLPSSYFDFSYF